MTQRIEDAAEVIVGRFYDVPGVRWTGNPKRGNFKTGPASYPPIIPISGPLHDDAEIVKFEEPHWHIDWRFVDAKHWKHVGQEWRSHRAPEYVAAARVLSRCNTDGIILRIRRRCARATIHYPQKQFVPWLHELEGTYQHASARCGVCPHRGISLVGAPMENGARVCPGHGLAWNLETGKLQPR